MFLKEQYEALRSKGYTPIITVFFSPKDCPGKYIARIFVVEPGKTMATKYCTVADTLEAMRAHIPTNQLLCFPRSPEDDPCVVESWL
ncbi:MAG: hypothetical protein IKK34_08265 [Clostridia bacterium]|nr:hypothetical protein [Clostridia bacterium]